MSALISKCESLLTTTKVLSSLLSKLSDKLRAEDPQTERSTQSRRQTPEQGPTNLLLLNVLQDLEGLQGQSETLQSQVEAIKTELQSKINQEQHPDTGLKQPPTPGERLPNSSTSQPDGTALSRCREGAQDEEGLMVEPENVGDTSSDEHEAQEDILESSRGGTKGDTSAIYAVAPQRAVAPRISVTTQCPGLPTAPRSSTPASPSTRISHTSHDMSPAASVGTEITWPDSFARGCSQDELVSRNEHGEQPTFRSEDDMPMQTDLLDKDNSRHEVDTTDRADVNDSSRNTHPDPTICSGSNEIIMDTSSPENIDPNDADQRYVLSPADMKRLVPRLAELECQGAPQHIHVPPIDMSLADLQGSIGIEDADWKYTSIRYEASQEEEGFARVYISHNTSSIDWSGFTAEVERPTIEEARAIFEKAVNDPPKEEIPYYVGHTNGFAQNALDPGPVVTGNSALKDLHTPHHHIGGNYSAHCCHCEDMTSVEQTSEGSVYHGLRSYNEVYFGTGYKLWLVIASHHVAEFDKFARSKWNHNGCNQGLRHESLLLAPSLLEGAGIEFSIAVVGRGEAFWTKPGQQHQVINIGHCAARSINFSHPQDELDLAKAVQCSDCGMLEVGKANGAPIVPPKYKLAPSKGVKPKRKRQGNQEPLAAPLRKATRTSTALQRELDEARLLLKDIQYRQPDIEPKNLTGVEAGVYKLVASVQSTLAIQQFVQLVQGWRERQSQSQATLAEDSMGSQVDDTMALVIHYEGKTQLHKFCLRLVQIRLAQEVDKSKRSVQQRASPKFLEDLASRHNTTKERVRSHLHDGRQWSKLCGSYDGLLAFILLDSRNAFGIKKDEWTRLSYEDQTMSRETFHNLLDNSYMRNMLEAGRALEKMVLFGLPVVFSWEKDCLNLTEDDIDVRIGQYTVEYHA